MQNTPIAVVIVSFNTLDLLRNCLASLRNCTLPLQIVVVDNASRDGSAAMVRAEFPEVELHALEQNLGFAAGNNLALQKLGLVVGRAKQEAGAPALCLLLNPDTVVHQGAIEALADFLMAHPRVGMVGPRLLNPDGSLQTAAFRFPTLSMTALDLFPPGEVLPGRLYNSWWHGRYPQEAPGSAPFPIDHPLGACMLVRREVIEQVGVFDEGYFMYVEEVEWCWRIHQAGWAIWQVPAAQVTHVGGAATSQFRAKMFVALYHSRLRFFRQHYAPALANSHKAIIVLGMLRFALLTWRDYAQRKITCDELRARLLAYGDIVRGAGHL
jgi:N-acetylglucosaminyl-diphospho-decaprenol L-rhamnosyltransferase